MTPIVLLVGQAGTGKDTVADFMVQNHGAVKMALADPMKRLAKAIFDFTDTQLWGPSEARNAVDPRYARDPHPPKARNPDEAAALAEDSYLLGNLAWKQAMLRCTDTATVFIVADILIRGLGAKPRRGRSTFDQAYDLCALTPENTGIIRKWVMDCGLAHLDDLTPRYVLQTLGTEVGRTMSKNLWVRYALGMAQELLGGGFTYDRAQGLVPAANPSQGPALVVITDGRFKNEILAVQRLNGAVVRIDSPRTREVTGGVAGHASEAEQKLVPDSWFTALLKNDKQKGLDVLSVAVDDLVYDLFDRRQIVR